LKAYWLDFHLKSDFEIYFDFQERSYFIERKNFLGKNGLFYLPGMKGFGKWRTNKENFERLFLFVNFVFIILFNPIFIFRKKAVEKKEIMIERKTELYFFLNLEAKWKLFIIEKWLKKFSEWLSEKKSENFRFLKRDWISSLCRLNKEKNHYSVDLFIVCFCLLSLETKKSFVIFLKLTKISLVLKKIKFAFFSFKKKISRCFFWGREKNS